MGMANTCELLLIFLCTVYCKKPNVLFIIVEDLRTNPWYPTSEDITPNIHRLASRGVTFEKAYAQISVCAPSRASLLTGLRPDTLGIYDFSHFGGIRFFRTITSHLHRSGYQTASAGKLQHWDSHRYYTGDYWGAPDWDMIHRKEQLFENASVTPDAVHNSPLEFFRDSYVLKSAISSIKKMHTKGEPWFQSVGLKGTHIPYHMPKQFYDLWANADIDISPDGLKFPLDAPLLAHVKKTEHHFITFMQQEGRVRSREREHYQSTTGESDGRTISKKGFTELMRGYLACISYTDFIVGQLLALLDAEGLWADTLIIFTSDHGMHNGEKGVWGKWTVFEEATNVPLIVTLPTSNSNRIQGSSVAEPVELIDIFPTIIELTGTTDDFQKPCPPLAPVDPTASLAPGYGPNQGVVFRIPKGGPRKPVSGEGRVVNIESHIFRHCYCDPLEGSSLAPMLIKHRGVSSNGHVKLPFRQQRLSFALSQKMTCKLPGGPRSHSLVPIDLDLNPNTPHWIDFCPNKHNPRNPPFGAMGYSMRTKEFRYIAWLKFNTSSFLPSLDQPPLVEQLYDHRRDRRNSTFSSFGCLVVRGVESELTNVANDAAFTIVQATLRLQLYDFLYDNASHSHLYHRRLDGRNSAIIHGRVSVPPRDLYARHFYRAVAT